jgi:SAM-dependent methyltransferase
MSELVTGEAYVAALATESSDRIAREAFIELALRLAPPRALVFDFGCGPGIDALVYADHGRRVCAYDVDTDMCASFRRRCADALDRGEVRLVEGSFREFLERREIENDPADLITANFAPLNLVPEPAALFEKFHAMLKPGGRLLVSMLNPLYRGDLRYAWWWRGLPALLLAGRCSVPGSQAPITRWRTARLMREARPHFVLEAVTAAPAVGRARPASHTPPSAAARFLFLQMRKSPAAP